MNNDFEIIKSKTVVRSDNEIRQDYIENLAAWEHAQKQYTKGLLYLGSASTLLFSGAAYFKYKAVMPTLAEGAFTATIFGVLIAGSMIRNRRFRGRVNRFIGGNKARL